MSAILKSRYSLLTPRNHTGGNNFSNTKFSRLFSAVPPKDLLLENKQAPYRLSLPFYSKEPCFFFFFLFNVNVTCLPVGLSALPRQKHHYFTTPVTESKEFQWARKIMYFGLTMVLESWRPSVTKTSSSQLRIYSKVSLLRDLSSACRTGSVYLCAMEIDAKRKLKSSCPQLSCT